MLHRYKVIQTAKYVAFKFFIALLFAGYCASASHALEPPTGEVLLKISGNIEITNHEDEAWFDLSMLQSLGTTEVKTETPWTDGLAHFKGVLIKDVMDSVGASGHNFEALALNKYNVSFTDIDYEKYPVIIAWELNGEPLTVRTLGPLWIMFPYSEYPEINTSANQMVAVWQLLRLDVY